MNQQNAPFLN